MNENKSKAQIYSSAEEALLKTKRIWEVLADQPDLSKSKVYMLLSLQKDYQNCPCCQYNRQESACHLEETGTEREDCHFCPLYPESDFGCDIKGQPYFKWVGGSFIEIGSKREAAREFLSLIDEALKQYKESQS